MESKVIPFTEPHVKTKKSPPLTSKMVGSLLAAIEKQKRKIPFGPADIKGSLTTLITRGLIVRKRMTLFGFVKYQWQVTEEAIILLKKLGIKT